VASNSSRHTRRKSGENLAGGERRGAVYTGLLEFGVTLDLEEMLGWSGATVHNSWLWLSGQGPSDRLVGDNIFAVSNIEGFATFRMFELWFQQNLFDDAISLRVGQLAADEEFAISEYGALFLNGTFGWPAFLSESIPNGGPGYPLATPGVRLEINPTEWLTFRTALFQGDPLAEDVNRHGFQYQFSGNNGALFLNELVMRWEGFGGRELPGSLKTGAWFHTANFADPGDEEVLRRGNNGFYFILDQQLFRPTVREKTAFVASGKGPAQGLGKAVLSAQAEEDDGVGLGSFLRVAFEPADRNELSFYVDGGLTYQGLIPGRVNDTLGVAVAYGKLSRGAVRALAEEDARNPGYELALEATYQMQVTPWFALQPCLQTIIRPGGSADFGNALVLGLRSAIEF
jgi:porin